jgi:CRP-like cAMP-binding protein
MGYSALISGERHLNLAPSAFVADRELIQALEAHSHTIQCDVDRVLFRQGDAPVGLYILRKGEATLTMESAAGEVVMRMQTAAGALLGLPGLIGNEPYSLTAVAGRGAELGFVPRDDFSGLTIKEPQLSLKVLQVLAAEVRSARQAILNLR